MLAILALSFGLHPWTQCLSDKQAQTRQNAQLTPTSHNLAQLIIPNLQLALSTCIALPKPKDNWATRRFLLVGLTISLHPAGYITPIGRLIGAALRSDLANKTTVKTF